MSIGYFPTIYEDELLYSVFARLYAHSGCLIFNWFANDIYMYKVKRPDTEFVNKLKQETVEHICKQMTWEEAVMKHTMYPYYSRFHDEEKKDSAKQALMDMGKADDDSIRNAHFRKMLSIPVNKYACLKYCPYCTEEDRRMYGETYWHRRHQVIGLDICYKHGCRLSESSVAIKDNGEQFICAEDEIDVEECKPACSDDLKMFAKYVIEILEQENYRTCVVGQYMKLKAKERYSRGKKKIICSESFMELYIKWKEESGLNDTVQKPVNIRNIFEGYKRYPVDICRMAYFLGIAPEEMAYPEFYAKDDAEVFSSNVESMIMNGMSIPSIAKELGASPYAVIQVCNEKGIHSLYSSWKSKKEPSEIKEERILFERKFWLDVKDKHPDMSFHELCKIDGYGRHLTYLRRADREWTDKHYFHRENRDLRDWKKLDNDTLPLVRNEIENILKEDSSAKITYSLLERKLNLYKGIWRKMPKCREVIDSYRVP